MVDLHPRVEYQFDPCVSWYGGWIVIVQSQPFSDTAGVLFCQACTLSKQGQMAKKKSLDSMPL